MLTGSFIQSTSASVLALITFILIIGCYAAGHYRKSIHLRKFPDQASKDTSTMTGALLALLGLMLAFSFSMANSRFDTRRLVIIEGANAIGTVILRTEMYPDSVRALLRSSMKEYVEARIVVFERSHTDEELHANQVRLDSISHSVWMITASYAKVDPTTVRTSELIPALNDMIDIVTTRRAAFASTIPDAIIYFLLLLCLTSAFLLAHDRKNNADWVVVIGFALMLSATIFTIIDLDRPQSGLINMDGPHQKVIELRNMFKAD
jgi:hypothetical protein